MKKTTTILLFFITLFSFGQDTYEVFQFDTKYGVVNTKTLDEFIEPKYEKWNDIFKDAIALHNGNEYTFYNQKTGKAESFTNTEESLRFNGDYHLHFLRDGKSVLIPRETRNLLFFDKKFDEVKGSGGDLIAKYNNMFDVYVKPNFKTPKLKNIEATKFFDGQIFRKRTNKSEFVTIFYGKEAVMVYDAKFNLLKKYPSAANYDSQMFEIISGEFTKIEEPDFGNSVTAMPSYFSLEKKDGYTTVKSNEYNKSFRLKGNFYDRIIYGKYDWIILIDNNTNQRYTFKIDYDKKQFMLPKKYQEQLELKFVD